MSFFLILAILAACLDLIGSTNYLRNVARDETRPHLFSWFLWCVLMGIGTALAISEGAYASALTIGVGSCINAAVCLLGFRRASFSATRGDWLALIVAVSAIPVWLATRNPLYAALLITLINLISCYPTFRKAWALPEEENMTSFSIFTGASLLRLASVSPFVWATALYPGAIALTNLCLVVLLWVRRRTLVPVPA